MGQARDRRPGAIDSNREVLLATPLLLEPVVVFYLPGCDSPGSDAPSRAQKVQVHLACHGHRAGALGTAAGAGPGPGRCALSPPHLE